MKPRHHKRRRPRRGYALLLVLFVLALAAAAMASIGRAGMEKALLAHRAEADVRRRWAVLTCQSVLLPKTESILAQSDAPASEARRTIVLNGKPLTLFFDDEQAKANANLLYARGGLSGADRDVRALVAASGVDVPVELRPVPGVGKNFGSPDADPDDPRAFETLDQLFGPQPPSRLRTARGKAPPLAATITCWGDGTINVARASDAACRAVLGTRLGTAQVNRLMQLRAKEPSKDVADLLDALNLPDARREAVENLLTDQSSCHSLWTIGDAGERTWYDLAVSEGDGRTLHFGW